jgi:hypothetical protein
MDRRYQVFVSSTYDDLREERQHVIQALLELDCIPAGMELFPAADDEQWEFIKRVIDECDYYLVIVAGRYGSTDGNKISYTEKEYDYALDRGKPVIGFFHENPGDIASNKCENDPGKKCRLEAFREKIKKRLCKSWSSAEDLSGKVSRSIAQLKKSRPADGWVRAQYAADPQVIVTLRNRIDELEAALKVARTQPPQGVNDLAQGRDPFLVKFSLALGQNAPGDHSRGTTWDELFAALGPAMLEGCSEQSLRSHLEPWLWPGSDWHVVVDDGDFRQIIIQLLALELIERGKKQYASDDAGTFWRLTEYGQNYLIKLRALHRKPEKPKGCE